GFVIVINGKVEGAELYGSHALFLKLWTKLINGAAIDALSEFDAKKKFTVPEAKDVDKFLAEASKGKEKEVLASLSPARGRNPDPRGGRTPRQTADVGGGSPAVPADAKPIPGRIRVVSVDNPKTVMLEAKDRKEGNVIHRSYISK